MRKHMIRDLKPLWHKTKLAGLNPVALARNLGFSASELRKIERIVNEHQSELLERWRKEYGLTSR